MTERSFSPYEPLRGGNDYHVPVLFAECMEALNIKPDGTYIDCTFGGGGHSRGILQRLGLHGRLLAFDQDPDAGGNLIADSRLTFVRQNFMHVHRYLRLYGIDKADGLLADLGVSSHQFDEAKRGFSYRFDAPLDMRMDYTQPITAAHVLNTYSAAGLQDLFSKFGEVTNARTLAAAIADRRVSAPFQSINDLLQVLQPLTKGNPNRYYAQVFQALRIEVNNETGVLRALLEQLPDIIKPGGRVAIITFHSLEDRMVKQFFKLGSFEQGTDPVYGGRKESPFRMVHKKPIEPGEDEVKRNPRSRSARLRVAERRV